MGSIFILLTLLILGAAGTLGCIFFFGSWDSFFFGANFYKNGAKKMEFAKLIVLGILGDNKDYFDAAKEKYTTYKECKEKLSESFFKIFRNCKRVHPGKIWSVFVMMKTTCFAIQYNHVMYYFEMGPLSWFRYRRVECNHCKRSNMGGWLPIYTLKSISQLY